MSFTSIIHTFAANMAPPGVSSSSEGNGPKHQMNGTSEKKIVVLDGGFATQLSCHVDKPIDGDILWSSRFLATDKEAVINSHLDFLRGNSIVFWWFIILMCYVL